MQFQVSLLRHWKREARCIEKCEDQLAADPERGLFAVSDGVGTMSFSGLWAQSLVERYVEEPLTSTDGFEVEYWVRRAQERFKTLVPDPENLPSYVQEDLHEGDRCLHSSAYDSVQHALPKT
jgi:serine/threonine protein phosphatase PrpC